MEPITSGVDSGVLTTTELLNFRKYSDLEEKCDLDCTLRTYSSLYIKGYNGLAVEYEPGFESALDDMNGFARDCDVTVCCDG